MKISLSVLIVFGVGLGIGLSQNKPRIDQSSVQLRTIQLPTASGSTDIQLGEFQVAVPQPPDGIEHANVLTVFEPRSGLFWWMCQTGNDESGHEMTDGFVAFSKAWVTQNMIVVFLYRNPILGVRQSSERASTFNELQTKILNILGSMQGMIEAYAPNWFQEIDFKGALHSDFYYPHESASPFPGAKLTGISRQENEWRVELLGANGDSATVRLNQGFEYLGLLSK